MISVIIPIYNSEQFLEQCLLSLANQTNKNFFAYLIDDGSTDGSSQIAKQFEKDYPKLFKYIWQENKGSGAARNNGLAQVDTEYLCFLDSDDFFGPRFIENVYKKIEEFGDFDIGLTPASIFDMRFNNYWDFFDADILDDIYKDQKVTNVKKNPELFSVEANFPRAIWRTEFLRKNDFKFEEIRWEDVEPHFTLFHAAEKIAFLEIDGGLYYRTNSGCGQVTSDTGKNRLDMIHVYSLALEKGKKNNWSDGEYVHFLRTMVLYTLWTFNVIGDDYRKAYVKGMSVVYRKVKLKYFFQYRKLPMPYRPYNKRFLIALCTRSILLKRIFYKKKTMDLFHKVWRKVFRR